MQVKITQEGLFISKEWLHGFDEFEIRREGRVILITPVTLSEQSFRQPATPDNVADEPSWRLDEDSDDPIFNLGKNPIDLDITDASINGLLITPAQPTPKKYFRQPLDIPNTPF
jgi:hypothetical protein